MGAEEVEMALEKVMGKVEVVVARARAEMVAVRAKVVMVRVEVVKAWVEVARAVAVRRLMQMPSAMPTARPLAPSLHPYLPIPAYPPTPAPYVHSWSPARQVDFDGEMKSLFDSMEDLSVSFDWGFGLGGKPCGVRWRMTDHFQYNSPNCRC